MEFDEIEEFSDWYTEYRVDHRGALIPNSFTDCAARKLRMYQAYKTEMDARVAQYEKYEKQANAEVVSRKPDLANISSGESAGFIRRISRNVVQHTPNVYINNEFDDESIPGVLSRYMLKSKIIGDDMYSNNMQQNLITTFRRAAALGFDCVIPVLVQDNRKKWFMKYDTIYYRDVFPEPGVKDIRQATNVFVRRYLTRGEVHQLAKNLVPGWDHAALKYLLGTMPASREYTDYENRKHSVNHEAYEVITWYNSAGEAFLTWAASSKILLRIEKNKHPAKEHPVFFFIPEKDDQQPLGKSLLSLTYGRQEFQDLFMNGVMKMLVRNINPPIIGYGTVNALPNLSPGKYTEISNPQARIEPFEVNTQAMMMFGQTSQQNAANMTQLIGAADQQMAAQSTGGLMSQTPQGVEAQQQMVDITTNNYQKAMEEFFSRYCSYALTIYFQELKNTKSVTVTADVRKELINEGVPPEAFRHEEYTDEDGVKHEADGTGLKDGSLKIDFSEMAIEYFVQCVPGSLVELEDEKQMRLLKEVFVPLSQAMPAIAQTGDKAALDSASKAMQYIVQKTIELSGSAHSTEIKKIFSGDSEGAEEKDDRVEQLEQILGGTLSENGEQSELFAEAFKQQQEQIRVLTEGMTAIMQRMAPGITGGQTDPLAAGAGAAPALPSPVSA
jgi:hypothetical protein